MLAIVLLVVGLGAFRVLVVTSRAIAMPIVLMTIVRLLIIAVALVASMIVGIFHCDADGSSIHGYVQQEDEPFFVPLAASYPWQSYQECQPPCWLPDTA
jgi:hypothetical protein